MTNEIRIKKKIKPFNKIVQIDGDKSLSIRWALIASQAIGKSKSINILKSEDVMSTLNCLKKLGIKRLPRNLLMAIEALKKDKLSDDVLGPVMKKSFLAYKNDEWERYHQSVTDWEVKEYLRLY